jgi:hypothetical protein
MGILGEVRVEGFRMKPLRLLYWPLVLVACVALWWSVAYWLEPRPIWEIPKGDRLHLFHHDAKRELLLGLRAIPNANWQFNILDGRTGNVLHQLEVPPGSYLPGWHDYIDQYPRLVGASLWWLHQTNDDDTSVTVKLNEWKFQTEQTVRIHYEWKAGRDTQQEEYSIRHYPLRFVWSPHTSKRLLVYYCLPTAQIMQETFNALNPFHVNRYWAGFLDYQQSVFRCQTWEWQPASETYQKGASYEMSPSNQAGRYPRDWTPDDKYYLLNRVDPKRSISLLRVDATTGKTNDDLDIQSPVFHAYGNLVGTSSLMLFKRHDIQVIIEDKKEVHAHRQAPTREFTNNWTINEWRPLLDTKTWKPVSWPSDITSAVLSYGHLQTDALDSSRLLFTSNSVDDNPQYQSKGLKWPTEFIFLRYQDGRLSTEHRLTVGNIMNCSHGVLCGQLFVQGSEAYEDSDTYLTLLQKIPWLYRWYWESWVKLNGLYVALLDTDDGKRLWKKQERRFHDPLPLLGSDRLLLRINKLYDPEPTGYECYALPMKLYSPWWGPGLALGLFFLAILHRLRQHHRQRLQVLRVPTPS